MSALRDSGRMTVGELSRRTGVPVKALRRYTDWGLIYTLGRSPANYRLYDTDALWCVRLISELRGLGLTLAEIRDLAHTYLNSDQALGPRLAGSLRHARARLEARIADAQEILRRIDAYEASHRSELAGNHELWGSADPRRCKVCA